VADVDLDRPDLDDVDPSAGGFKRAIAVAVVLITFFGSVVAYLQAVESNKEDVAAREAQRDAITGLGEQVDASSQLAADLRISTAVDAQLQRQVLAATRVAAFEEGAAESPAALAGRRFAEVAAALAPLTPIDLADLTTFDAERAGLFEGPDAARLRQSVEADLANDHGDKADSYVAVLTVLAVALFLLGLSLTVQGRSRFVLVIPGLVIALTCVAWAAYIRSGDVTRVSERAVQEVAEGRRLLNAGDIDAAIEAFDEAIDDSPQFAAAFALRSSARFLQGSPQLGQTAFRSITSEEALEDAIDDLDSALALGADTDVNTVAEGGFLRFLDGDFDRSIELSSQALELNDRLAPVWFNLGVAHVARGDEDEAERAYEDGLDVLEEVPDEATRAAVIAGARTDLSILREILPGDELDDVAELIEDTEVRLATFELERADCGGRTCEDVGDGDGIEVAEAEFFRSGAFVVASAAVDGMDDGDAVGAVWYFRTDDSLPFEQALGSFNAAVVTDGAVTTSTLPVGDPPCPLAAEYLVRFYAGETFLGEQVGTVEPSVVGEAFTFHRDGLEGFEACVPASTEPTQSDLSDSDAFTSFVGADVPFVIGVNVTPGALLPGVDPGPFVEGSIAGLVPNAVQQEVDLNGVDVDGNFVALRGILAVDQAEGVAVAAAAGPDSSSRIILITGQVSEELLREVVDLVAFTGVGAPAG
jgi:tetratricopeptide (TPR) repeat protein